MALSAGSNEDGCSKNSVDRISHLFLDVTERILECLPLKDAISFLIIRLFVKLHILMIVAMMIVIYANTHGKSQKICLHAQNISTLCFSAMLVLFISLSFAFLTGFLEMQTLVAGFNLFLVNLSRNFTIRPEQNTYLGLLQMRKVPSCMFSGVGFDHLTHLTLIKFRLTSLPPTFSGFPRLVSLQVHLFFMTDGEANKIEILVSKCSLLESLDLDLHEGKSCLSIHAPKLQNLLSSICLEETNKIKTLSLKIPLHQHQKRDTIMEFFTCLPNIEQLVKLLGQLRQLRDLTFHGVTFINQVTISFICCFVKMAPKLQKFYTHTIDAGQPSTNNMIVDEDCCLDYLRSAKFRCHHGTLSPTLQLIKLILASSPILEAMIIEAIEEDKDKLNIVKELL
ncbi:LOW QUALITY PROTEIN: hypothetical protein Cgig2_018403 [Carnegiea gigantea]|uniref:Uncharacterized protein n=1 Tax=Carnegiea gigantea TaxID=171969 RepID=A0A9Q1GQF6_9CARY|nr:LOW QUALITY PROTEIN: hypothetical protein Cgig2_018403 [Carnegiea gigantea]